MTLSQPAATPPPFAHIDRPALRQALQHNSKDCIQCNICQKECPFLQKYGSPKRIADAYNPAMVKDQIMPFECSLCGLCVAVCPVKVDPAAMFLEMRRDAVSREADMADYGVIRNYEKRGTSKRYSYYALPEDCDTVLFPGCTLPGTRPDKVKALFDHLQETIPNLGIVLDCCTKPSHDLGHADHFQAMFTEMRDYLTQHGVQHVLVACPNCYRVFSQYGDGLRVKTVYEHMAATSLPQTPHIAGQVTIHDPCGTRDVEPVHAAVRTLVTAKSLHITEMAHRGPKTICCGEGGSVGCLNPGLAQGWGIRRKEEAAGRRILTYCAGCANFLGAKTPTSHILDLLFDPEATLAGQAKISKAPWTYLNRLRLKSHFKKKIKGATCRERVFSGEDKTKGSILQRTAILLTLLAALGGIHLSGATAYLEPDALRGFIAACGPLAPVIYMLTYSVAPALFLPGLPITIAGGILFGPFWGVVYSITGATAGSCIAFLVSRYLGRGWIETKLRSSKWQELDRMVEQHGWKAVAFTRLIPLFPFNLLNYAFGLTRVKFSHYALTSFVCMLPACIAFIVFSSSLLELLKGNVTPSFIVGILLIAGVSAIPLVYKRKTKSAATPNPVDQAAGEVAQNDPRDRVRASLKKKGVALLVMLGLGGAATLLVYKYFYYLDAFLYTYEFYWLFNVKNLQAGDVAMFADFFRPMGIGTEALPQVILSHLIQNLYLPFSKPILVSACTNAFGPALGALFNYLAYLVVGMLSFGLGSFILGDMLPYLKQGGLAGYKTAITRPAALIQLILFAVPLVPISVIAITSAALKVSFRQTMQMMLFGLTLRLGWLLALPLFFS